MFRESYFTKVNRFSLAVEKGAVYVTDGIKVVKLTVEYDLRHVTKKRLKGNLNSEKYFYGIVSPLLTREEQFALVKQLELVEKTFLDSIINFLLITNSLNVTALYRACQPRNVYRVIAESKILTNVA